MNWGHKIALSFTVFVGIMMYMVITSFNQDIDLVTENYYQEEIQYEKQMVKLRNVKELEETIVAKFILEGIELSYPSQLEGKLTGNIQLYRPSSAKRDKMFEINPTGGTNRQLISAQYLTSGKYLLKIDFSDGAKNYFQEISLFVP